VAEVRRLDDDDRPAWLNLRAALYPDVPAEALGAEVTHLLGDPLEAGYGVFEDGALVGFVEVSERPWGEGCETAPVGWIESILVAADRRRSGAGRLLIDAAANWSRARGLKELGSDVETSNAASLASHLAWGFGETMRLAMFRIRL